MTDLEKADYLALQIMEADEEYCALRGGYPNIAEAVGGYVVVASADENGGPDLTVYEPSKVLLWADLLLAHPYKELAPDEDDCAMDENGFSLAWECRGEWLWEMEPNL